MKRAVMGVETLILFIAMILVASVAATVMIRTGDVLQQKALQVGGETRQRVTAFVEVTQVTGTDGLDHELEDFDVMTKLSAGSDPIRFNTTYLRLVTKLATINYRYTNLSYHFTNRQREYGRIDSTWMNLSSDLDEDYRQDYIKVNTTNVAFNLTSLGLVFVRIGDVSTAPATVHIFQNITYGSTVLGTLQIDGTTTINNELDAAMNVTVTPSFLDIGTFEVAYPQKSSNWQDGILENGDAARLHFNSNIPVKEGESMHLSIIIDKGSANMFYIPVPDVMNTVFVPLYP